MKWYIFNDSNNSKELNIILDHNTSESLIQNYSLSRLEKDTTTWDSSLNVRLITADEIAQITEADIYLNWNSTNDFSYTYVQGSNVFIDYYLMVNMEQMQYGKHMQ